MTNPLRPPGHRGPADRAGCHRTAPPVRRAVTGSWACASGQACSAGLSRPGEWTACSSCARCCPTTASRCERPGARAARRRRRSDAGRAAGGAVERRDGRSGGRGNGRPARRRPDRARQPGRRADGRSHAPARRHLGDAGDPRGRPGRQGAGAHDLRGGRLHLRLTERRSVRLPAQAHEPRGADRGDPHGRGRGGAPVPFGHAQGRRPDGEPARRSASHRWSDSQSSRRGSATCSNSWRSASATTRSPISS